VKPSEMALLLPTTKLARPLQRTETGQTHAIVRIFTTVNSDFCEA